MPRLAVVTDSCTSIPESLREALGICWVPYYIHRGKEVLRDLVTAPREAFYCWMSTATELPKTATPDSGDCMRAYEELADEQGTDPSSSASI